MSRNFFYFVTWSFMLAISYLAISGWEPEVLNNLVIAFRIVHSIIMLFAVAVGLLVVVIVLGSQIDKEWNKQVVK